MNNSADALATAVLLAFWPRRQSTLPRLAAATGASAEAVAGAIATLIDRGCIIESNAEGLTLIATGLPCWRDFLERRAADQSRLLGRRTRIFRTTTSTNDVCWDAAGDSLSNGLVVLADAQSRGRGRRGDPWLADPGQSILMSILLTTAPRTETLTLRLGLACAQAVEQLLGQEVQIKWPNDILIGGKKICGILVEMKTRVAPSLETDGMVNQSLVLGIGLNVAQAAADFPASLRSLATSLYLASGRQFDRLLVIDTLLEHIERHCISAAGQTADEIEHHDDFAWLDAWKSRCAMLGQTITVRQHHRTLRGQVIDIDPLHGLVLRDSHGGTHFLPAQNTTIIDAYHRH